MGRPPKNQIQETKNEKKVSKFIRDLASMLFYDGGGDGKFEELSSGEQDHWFVLASSTVIVLDKMNYVVVPKENVPSPADAESRRNRTVNRMTKIIKEFLSDVKTAKCPQCGKNADLKGQIFPCEELATRIWNGGN